MNKRFRLVLPTYEFVKSEQRYAEMAEQGWLLEKRGNTFEAYRRSDPQKRQYRLEFRPVRFLDGIQEMDEEELAVYADCGWELVSKSGGVYVFSSPGEAEDSELYTDRSGQLAMLKRSRKYASSAGLAWLGFWVASTLLRFSAGSPNLLSVGGLFGGDWLSLLILVVVIYVLWATFYSAYRCNRLVRLVKKGVSLRSQEASSQSVAGKTVKWALRGILAVCAAGSLFLLATSGAKPLPESSPTAPYLLLTEVFEGKRVNSVYGVQADNEIRTLNGLLSRNYNVEEAIELPDGDIIWLDQQVFLLRWGDGPARALARSLLGATAFADDGWGGEDEMEVPGFDYVITCRYACAAVKGDRVVCFTGANSKLNESWGRILQTLLKKWEESNF